MTSVKILCAAVVVGGFVLPACARQNRAFSDGPTTATATPAPRVQARAPAPSPRPPPTRSSVEPPQDLPEVAKRILDARMKRHAQDTNELIDAALALDHERAAAAARRIAAEPRIARPTPGAVNELNAALPPRFFDLQDELHDSAERLAAAAERHDDQAMARELGGMIMTCVNCHAVYRHGKGGRRP